MAFSSFTTRIRWDEVADREEADGMIVGDVEGDVTETASMSTIKQYTTRFSGECQGLILDVWVKWLGWGWTEKRPLTSRLIPNPFVSSELYASALEPWITPSPRLRWVGLSVAYST